MNTICDWLSEAIIIIKFDMIHSSEVVYMNPDWVSILNDTSNSVRVYMGDWVKDWKITANENLIRIEIRFRFMYQQSYFSGDFSTYTLKYMNKTFCKQSLFRP